jgi:hypothetical protein
MFSHGPCFTLQHSKHTAHLLPAQQVMGQRS